MIQSVLAIVYYRRTVLPGTIYCSVLFIAWSWGRRLTDRRHQRTTLRTELCNSTGKVVIHCNQS